MVAFDSAKKNRTGFREFQPGLVSGLQENGVIKDRKRMRILYTHEQEVKRVNI